MVLLKRSFTEFPFNKGWVIKLFDNNIDLAKDIISTIVKINNRLSVCFKGGNIWAIKSF